MRDYSTQMNQLSEMRGSGSESQNLPFNVFISFTFVTLWLLHRVSLRKILCFINSRSLANNAPKPQRVPQGFAARKVLKHIDWPFNCKGFNNLVLLCRWKQINIDTNMSTESLIHHGFPTRYSAHVLTNTTADHYNSQSQRYL